MLHARIGVYWSALAVVGITASVSLVGAQERIVGLTTVGGGAANTTDLIVRRPPIGSGRVTSAGSDFSAAGSWTEGAGTSQYSVSVKSDGSWKSSGQMQEKLVVTIANYKKLAGINGTWRFESVGSCSKDPWRFPVKCTGISASVVDPTGKAAWSKLTAAVPYPLSAAGHLSAADINAVSLAEVVAPPANHTFASSKQANIKVLVHDASVANTSGSLVVDVRPYGAEDFPSQSTMKDYVTKSVSASVGSTTQVTFDLSGHDKYDWQVTAAFKGPGGKRSSWVRFRTPKVMKSPSKILDIEGELAAKPWSGVSANPAGAVTAQAMQQFGSNWSGGAHLLWGAGGAGDMITITFDVPAAGTYAAELYMTRAPDFGDVEVTLAGSTPGWKFFGFSPKVMWSGPIQMGKFQLAAGPNTLTIRVTGKYADSKGYRVGFDRLRLYPS